MMRTAKQPALNELDALLEMRVKAYLATKRPALGKLSVSADAGTVRLSGPVSSFYLRQLALSAASRVAGVLHVVDDIEVPVPSAEVKNRKPR